MRITAFACAVALLFKAAIATSPAAAFEKQEAALDGTQYAVLTGAVNYVNSSASFLRFFNGGPSTASFQITIVNPATGATVGSTFSLSVPSKASIQHDIFELLGTGYAGTTLAKGSGAYALFIKSTEPLAGYQHILYNGNTDLFENVSVCTTPLNQATLASSNQIVLLNLTSNLSSLANYPSNFSIFNYSNIAATYRISVVNALTGNVMDSVQQTVQPNTAYSNSFANMQNLVGWTPASNELWGNLLISDVNGVAPQVIAGTSIANVTLKGAIGESTACAVNAPVSTAITATTQFDAVMAPDSGASATLSFTIPGSGSSSSTEEKAAKAAFERAQSSIAVTGTLHPATGSAITLSGTYDTTTRAISLSGGGYTFTGAVSGTGTVSGTFTSPTSSGSFGGGKTSATSPSKGYCGTYSGHDDGGPTSGTFNIVVTGTTFTGSHRSSDDGGLLKGTVINGVLSGYSYDDDNSATLSGTVTATTASGTYGGTGFGGTWTGSSCGSF